MVDDIWLDAASAVSAETDADLRAEAADVFAAEAARTRLVDLRGDLRIRVRCGQVVAGTVATSDAIDHHLVLDVSTVVGISRSAAAVIVPASSVVHVDGARVALRDESPAVLPRSLASWLRERWSEGEAVRILDRTGAVHMGSLSFVGADHVRLDDSRCIAFGAIDAWWG